MVGLTTVIDVTCCVVYHSPHFPLPPDRPTDQWRQTDTQQSAKNIMGLFFLLIMFQTMVSMFGVLQVFIRTCTHVLSLCVSAVWGEGSRPRP